MDADKDSWETPRSLFDTLNLEFNFDVDLCATNENTKVPNSFYQDYLSNIYTGGELKSITCFSSAFMNPPYSRGSMKRFLTKAWDDSKNCKIVCVVKVDSSTGWWSIFYDASRFVEKPGCKIRLLPKRVKFTPPKGWSGKNTGPSFPTAVLVFDRRNTQ